MFAKRTRGSAKRSLWKTIFKRPLILVVDNDPTTRQLIRASLEPHGLRIAECCNDTEAMAAFGREMPQLVLLNADLPGIDGFAVCERMRKEHAEQDIPIVMITTPKNVAARERAFACGATDFITNPLHRALLYHRVRYILRAHEAFRALQRSAQKLAQAQRIARLGYWEWDFQNNSLFCSEGIYHLVEQTPENAQCSSEAFFALIHPQDRKRVRVAIGRTIAARGRYELDHRIQLPSGEVRFLHHQGEVIVDEHRRPLILQGILQDISQRKRAEERMHALAYYDSLTGLANRSLFKELARAALGRARRNGKKCALIYLDLDQFKRINETLEHPIGDDLLKKVGAALNESVRDYDIVGKPGLGKGIPLGHLGGDELTIFLADIDNRYQVQTIAERLLLAISQPLATGGIALFPNDGRTVDILLKNAETAMFAAKKSGDPVQFYASPMTEQVQYWLSMEKALRRALKNEELELYYQPQMDIVCSHITGVEALVRWNHPKRGLLSPDLFIPFAEDSGFSVPVGEWVLYQACLQSQAWRQEIPVVDSLQVSVNLSARQFRDKSLIETVRRILDLGSIPPHNLALKVTETAVMHNVTETADTLRNLKGLGLKLSLDDFGTGYSSMNYLRKFPFDILKIDRSFVANIHRDQTDAEIVRAIIVLAKALNLEVVTEGVETLEQLRRLKQLGCTVIQGYLIAKPLPYAEMSRLLLSSKTASHQAPYRETSVGYCRFWPN